MTTLQKIRQALSDYMYAEGCSCCRHNEEYKAAKEKLGKKLGKILKVPKFKDGSGYDFWKFRSKQAKS